MTSGQSLRTLKRSMTEKFIYIISFKLQKYIIKCKYYLAGQSILHGQQSFKAYYNNFEELVAHFSTSAKFLTQRKQK